MGRWKMEWQPIETAPKDGTEILVCAPSHGKGPGQFVVIVTFLDGEWTTDRNSFDHSIWPPTHWMPLPHPPSSDTCA